MRVSEVNSTNAPTLHLRALFAFVVCVALLAICTVGLVLDTTTARAKSMTVVGYLLDVALITIALLSVWYFSTTFSFAGNRLRQSRFFGLLGHRDFSLDALKQIRLAPNSNKPTNVQLVFSDKRKVTILALFSNFAEVLRWAKEVHINGS